MVGDHARGELGIEGGERSEDQRAAPRVRRDLAPLFARKTLPLVHDVEQRLVDLTDVVKERDPLDRPTLMLLEPRLVADDERVGGHAANVHPCLLVIGLDGVEQRLERGGSHALHQTAGLVLAVHKHRRGESGGQRDGGIQPMTGIGSHGVVIRKNRAAGTQAGWRPPEPRSILAA